MGFRIRKRVKLMPGVHLNLSNRGISTSVGVKGATVNIGKTGTRLTTGIPGSGISHTQQLTRAPRDSGSHRYPDSDAPSPYDQIFGQAFRSGLAGAALTFFIGYLLAPNASTSPNLRSATFWAFGVLAIVAFIGLFRRRRRILLERLSD